MNITVKDVGGMYVAEVRPDEEDEVLFTSDPSSDAQSASKLGEAWAQWFDGLSEGRIESVYYILAIPETWPGPPSGSHPYSGLYFKIGRAKDVRKRVQNLRTGTSSKLIVHALEPGSPALEAVRHRQFEAERRQGEWFSCSPALVRHVFDTWKRHRAMPPEDQAEMMALMDRIDILRGVRSMFGGAPDMINPSLNEDWCGNIFVDLVYANPVWKKRG
jgi:hypothetical protein